MIENIKNKILGFFPEWFIKITKKTKGIFPLALVIGAVFLFMFALPYFIGLVVVIIATFVIPRTSLWEKFKKKYDEVHDFRHGSILLLVILAQLFLNKYFEFDWDPYGFLPRVFDVVTVFLGVTSFIELFKDSKVKNFLKYSLGLLVFLLARVFFQKDMNLLAEEFGNIFSLLVFAFVFVLYLYEIIKGFMIRKGMIGNKDLDTELLEYKTEKSRVYIFAKAVLFVTLIVSPFFFGAISGIARINSINAIENEYKLDKLPNTFYGSEIPLNSIDARRFLSQDLGSNEAIFDVDMIPAVDGSFQAIGDVINTYWRSFHYGPFSLNFRQKTTEGIKKITVDDKWKIHISDINHKSMYNPELSFTHNANSAVKKQFGPIDYVISSAETYEKVELKDGSTYGIIPKSRLSNIWAPYKVPDGFYAISDANQSLGIKEIFFGTGKHYTLKEAGKFKKLPLIGRDVIIEAVKSIKYRKGFIAALTDNGLRTPDRDSNNNIIIEAVMTKLPNQIEEEVCATIEFVANTVSDNDLVNDKIKEKIGRGVMTLETWFIPLSRTNENGKLIVYIYDNKAHHNTYYASSQLENVFLTKNFVYNYKLLGQSKVIRDGFMYYLGNRSKSNSKNSAILMDIALYSTKAENVTEVKSRAEMEKMIKEELSQ